MKGNKYVYRPCALLAVFIVLGVLFTGCAITASKEETISAKPQITPTKAATTKTIEQVQNITSKISAGSYPEITVKKGEKVHWVLQADAKDLNACNNRLVIPTLNIEKTLQQGDNIIEFTPAEEGRIAYTCWMGMITSHINVVSDSANASASAGNSAAGKISADDILVAKVVNGMQEVTINVGEGGYSPAAIVLQKGVKTVLKFNPEKLNSCNNYVNFPYIGKGLDLSKGETTLTVQNPEELFTFECGMGMLHGYIKAVEDPGSIDLEAIKNDLGVKLNISSCCGY